jgi:two-component system, cell cycle sensor histidine kinase and response regulator CckA
MNTEDQNENPSGKETRTESALRASELSYRRLFEAAKDGILILEVETGRITDVNPFLFKLLGFSRSEMIGQTVGELSPFKDMESNKIMLERLQKDRYVRYEDLPLETRDGRKIAVEFVSNVYRASDRDVIQCNIRDITERKAAEKERSRLAAIIEFSDEAIVSKTMDGIVIGWNQGAEKQYGYTTEEIIGHSVSILYPPDHYEEYLQIMKKVRNGETLPSFDTVRRRKDGTLINVSVTFAPIEARDGEVVVASKYHDITRIKKLEAQFIQAQKMEVVGQLASGVAHDFNNILVVIMIYSSLIRRDLDPDSPLREYTEEIRHASERAAGLTRQLLVFSRKQKVQPIVLDLNNVVEDLNQMLRRLIDESIELTIVPFKQLGRVKADPGYVGQVLMNLTVNARDAMPKGGEIRISARNVAAMDEAGLVGDFVELAITDQGDGMTPEVAAQVFEPFFTTKAVGQGTGLGLSQVYGFVRASGGRASIDSRVGEGTTLTMLFPRAVGAAPRAEPPPPRQATPLPAGKDRRILLVDDDDSVAAAVEAMLEELGYRVVRAADAGQALTTLDRDRGFDIVLSDMVMPGTMGGIDLAREIARRHEGLPVVLSTGYSDAAAIAVRERVRLLAKPYRLESLAAELDAAVAEGEHRRGMPA